MEVLMSNCSNDVRSLPEKYVFPPDERTGKHFFPDFKKTPMIDLEKADVSDQAEIVQQIFNASQVFRFFQVINHGIPLSLIDDTMNVFKKFFAMPAEYKATFYSNDVTKKCGIFSSTMNYDNEEVHYWRDNFTHHCHPLQDLIDLWPEKPARNREVVSAYSIEARKFLLRILDFIRRGLELAPGYFDNDLSKIQLLSVNHHIPCPDPSLTLGMLVHCDSNLITLLHQCSVPGLQVFHQGEWMNIEPLPHALIVIPGLQLKAISNGKFSSPIHRVLTHSEESRTTIGTFLIPSHDTLIEPANVLVGNSPVDRGFTYKEFYRAYVESGGNAVTALECFKNETETICSQ